VTSQVGALRAQTEIGDLTRTTAGTSTGTSKGTGTGTGTVIDTPQI